MSGQLFVAAFLALARFQTPPGVDDLALTVHAEAFGDTAAPLLSDFAGIEVDRGARQVTLGLCGGRRQSGPRSDVGPCRPNHRLEDRHRNPATRRTAAERAPPVVGVVIADPHRDRHVVGEADVVRIVGGAGLSGDVR
jgi:hypothetical protein